MESKDILDFVRRIEATISLWKKLHRDALAKGFKGLRVAGEAAWFFSHNMVRELLDYERSLHHEFEVPMAAVCAYNTDVATSVRGGELYLDLIKAHKHVIFAGPKAGLVKTTTLSV